MAMKLVTITFGGKTFQCTTRTRDHLHWTAARLKKRWGPQASIRIIQGSYHHGPLSAGTHDFDAVVDVRIVGIPGLTKKSRWMRAQTFLRYSGWAAWWRHTGTWANEADWHIHMASIPTGIPDESPTPTMVGAAYRRLGIKVGKYIDGGLTSTGKTSTTSQIDDYYAHALGLAGQHRAGSDPTPHPSPINAYVFKG